VYFKQIYIAMVFFAKLQNIAKIKVTPLHWVPDAREAKTPALASYHTTKQVLAVLHAWNGVL